MTKVAAKPVLTDTQLEFLRVYSELEEKLGRGPSIREMAAAHGGYADHSGAQHMMHKLRDLGVIRMKETIQGGLTEAGARLLGKRRRKQSPAPMDAATVSRRSTRP